MLTEFGLIEIAKGLVEESPQNGFEGIGDDCAILPIGSDEALVYTTDLVVEGVHFLLDRYTPEEVAHKSLNVNLSDVAAMGVKPVATLLSVALPRKVMESDWAERFLREYARLSALAEVTLIGGDTTSSLRDIVINVTAIGRGKLHSIKRRRDARAGDIIYVSGELGASGAGLREFLNGVDDTPNISQHKSPTAQLLEGEWLGKRCEVHAMMDISDGIASDLRHILKASKLGAELNIEHIPIAQGATIEDAVGGGEDYKLLFTVDSSTTDEFERAFKEHFGYAPYPIGRIVCGEGIKWLENGVESRKEWHGFVHY